MRAIFSLFSLLLLHAGAIAQTQVIDNVLVVPEGSAIQNGTFTGEVAITDWENFRTKCTLEDVKEIGAKKAKRKGGNVLRIVRINPPDSTSKCYRLFGEVFKVDDISSAKVVSNTEYLDSINRSVILQGSPYALIYFYFVGTRRNQLVQVYADDDGPLTKEKVFKASAKVFKEGKTRIWLPQAIELSNVSEKANGIDLDLEHGKAYFIKISCNQSFWFDIQHVRTDFGLREYLPRKEN